MNVPAGFSSVAFDERFVTSTSIGPAIVLERVVRSGGRFGLSTVITVHEDGSRLLRSGKNGVMETVTIEVMFRATEALVDDGR